MRSSDQRPALWAFAAAVLAAGPALALSQVPGPIEIGPSWGRVDSNGATLYTTIINRGVLADRLTGGTCSGFGEAALAGLDPSTQGTLADEKGVFIPPGKTVGLDPSGARLALSAARHAVEDGALIPCTLDFVHSGQRIVVFRVGQPESAATEP